MFNIEEKSKTPIEKDVVLEDMEKKYPEKIRSSI